MYGVYHIDIDIHLPYLNQPDSRAILGGSATTTWMMDVHATQKKAMICSWPEPYCWWKKSCTWDVKTLEMMGWTTDQVVQDIFCQ